MDVLGRVSPETAAYDEMLAAELRQRYEFAGVLCRGLRVIDLCCGSGFGTRILAGEAETVLGVDHDVAKFGASVGKVTEKARLEAADPLEFLASDRSREFDAVVCLDGLVRLRDLDRTLALLHEHADCGTRLIVSVPNSSGGRGLDYDEARRAFGGFPEVVLVPQFRAEGSVIAPPAAQGADVRARLDDTHQREDADQFIFCVGVDAQALERANRLRLSADAGPSLIPSSEELKREIHELRRENARLARSRFERAGSAAGSALETVAQRQGLTNELVERCRKAEARARELEAMIGAEEADRHVVRRPADLAATPALVEVFDAAPAQIPAGEDPNSWEQRRRRAATVLVPWIEQSISLAGKTVLEYGCGNAAVSCAVAEKAGRVIGLDIDAGGIALGEREVAERDLDNVELELHPLDGILDAVRAHKGEVDVFLLYAVLEHLTVQERLSVIRLARDVVADDGAIVVCETPNRLIYFDHHTARMPFFHFLPDELAAEYYPYSNRRDFKDAIDSAAERGPEARLEAIVRWGRGVSYHEFELVFDDLSRHVIASSYDPVLFPERPVQPEEAILSRHLEGWRPDLAPTWSRYWLDMILSPEPVQRRPRFIRPWAAETIGASGAAWTRWDNLRLDGPAAQLPIWLPHATSRLLVGSVTQDGQPVAIVLRPPGRQDPLVAVVSSPAHHTGYSSFRLPVPAQSLTLEVSRPCNIVFVGYED